MTEPSDDLGHARAGALEALLEIANAADHKKFGIAIDAFWPEDYEEIIQLAWRYQFDDDRSKFKREIHALENHVSERILARLELSE